MRIALSAAVAVLLPAWFASNAHADACMDVCKQQNRADVRACNYPEKEPQALRECLATARNNFDACKQACGK
jgi:hypothetical protein